MFSFKRNPYLGRRFSSFDKFLTGLDTIERERVNNYRNLWDFYEGRQWGGEFESLSEERSVMINYCRAIVNIKAKFLVKNSVDIQIVDNPTTKVSEVLESGYIKELLDQQWYLNNKDIFLLNMATSGGIQGDVFVRPYIAKNPTGGKDYVRLSILPAHYVFPVYGDSKADHLDRHIMTACHIIYPVLNENERKNSIRDFMSHKKDRTNKYIWYRETWTQDEYFLFEEEKLIKNEDNLFGEIPIVHVKNLPSVNSDYGISDLADVIPLQRAFNEVATEMQAIIHYYASPITIIKGARLDNLDRGPNKVWSINSKDAEVKNLTMDDDLKASQDYLTFLFESMLKVTSIPEPAINPTSHVSNTPGVAMNMSFQPLVEERKIKELTYGSGIKQINRIMLKALALTDYKLSNDLEKLKDYKYNTEISFGPPLPRDTSIELTYMQTRLDMGITTRVRELVKQGVGEAEAQQIIKAADEEKRARLELENLVKTKISDDFKLSEKEQNTSFGKSGIQDPHTHGDKISEQHGHK